MLCAYTMMGRAEVRAYFKHAWLLTSLTYCHCTVRHKSTGIIRFAFDHHQLIQKETRVAAAAALLVNYYSTVQRHHRFQ
jgi:hypothetical protein